MRRFGMRIAGWMAAGLVAAGLMALPGRAMAQDAASVHGHVQNAIGMALTSGDVKMTTDRSSDAKSRKYEYSFPIDASGNYKGDGIKPGKYTVVAFQGTVSVDFMLDQTFAAGDNKTVDFDMTRKEYIDKMTPEEKAAMEDTKKKNATAMAANSKIANLNNALKDARADIASANFDAAIKAMTDATTAKPDEAILWITLGDAQLGQATAADKAAHAAHATDASLPDKYTAAATSYQKALSLNGAAAKPSADLTAAANNQLGQIYGKTGKTKEASDAYELAAKTDPTKAAMYYFNEAATLYNAQDMDDAAAAADKAIAADPTKAQAYYIKGQSLVQKATVDAKTNKITVPPGCVEAYQKFLELAPTGPQADEVKGVLTGIGASVQSTYKADTPKKK
jgi:tetratricopeptide (TPR) repeat protein